MTDPSVSYTLTRGPEPYDWTMYSYGEEIARCYPSGLVEVSAGDDGDLLEIDAMVAAILKDCVEKMLATIHLEGTPR